MSLSFLIARRYLFSKKSHNAINWISGIACTGIAIATMAMVVVLSVFNGFHDLLSGLYTTFDPELKVTPVKGKYAAADDPTLQRMKACPNVKAATETVEDNALILFKGHPTVITLKGVDDNYPRTSSIKSILFTADGGFYRLHSGTTEYAIPGSGLAVQMGGVDYGELQICAPRQGRIVIENPSESFNAEMVSSPGVVFNVNQRKYDEHYMLTSLQLAQRLFEHDGQITSLELALKDHSQLQQTKQQLLRLAKGRYTVQDRLEQQEGIFSIMQIEKLLAWAFLTFILLIACFNIISSVSMLIIEKRQDVQTLHHLGLSQPAITRIFLYEGRIISLIGGIVGVFLGLLLCLLQQQFGIIKLGSTESSFIVNAYPVSVKLLDIVGILLTAIIVGFAATWYPVNYVSKRLLK